VAEGVENQQSRPTTRGFWFGRRHDALIQRVGQHLAPRRRVNQLTAGRDHAVGAIDGALHSRRHRDELVGDRFHRGPEHLRRLRPE
jgi:hypothetical protein